MFRSSRELINYVLVAEDGEIGRCKDFLFDDRHWILRYMVADTGKWLPGRKVLISPLALGEPDWALQRFPVNLTKAQIEDSPPLDADAPVSRQYEIKYFHYYQWPYYRIGAGVWEDFPYPPPSPVQEGESIPEEEQGGNLRSMKEVMGYHIQAEDGEVGHVEDFILEEAVWVIRYMIVDTRNWLPGRKILVSPGWIDTVDWGERKVRVKLTTNAIEQGPEFDPSEPVNREYEIRLYDYYGRPRYWE